jgi:TRAP-type C4-dicarboxylate transport system substrate-binding protein
MKAKFALALGIAVALAGVAPAKAEDQIRAIAAFTKQVGFTQSFLRFIDKANAAGKGTYQIQFVGGPEAVPTFEQAKAVRSGVADMGYTPSSYYAGEMPEIEALVGGNAAPWEARANGGFDMINDIHKKKMNAHILAWVEYGPRFNFYLKNQPKTRPDGLPDLTGMKLRGAPAYRELMATLGGTFVNMAAPEVYTGLERGTVEGFAWPQVGIMDLGWEKFVKHKVMPTFFNLDIIIMVNLDTWNKLSAASRDGLQKLAIAWEKESSDWWLNKAKEEQTELAKRGVQDFTLAPEAGKKYVKLASDTVWERMKSRAPDTTAQLKPKLYKE